MANRLYTTDIIKEFKIFTDWEYDPWGECMSLLFDVCGELKHRNPGIGILSTLDYSPGLGCGRDPESQWFEMLQDVHTGDLVWLARLFGRYADKLKLAGKDY